MAPAVVSTVDPIASKLRLTLQLRRAVSKNMGQILKVIARRNAKATHKVPGSALQVAVRVIHWRKVVFGPAEISVTRNRSGAVELTKAILCFRLCCRVESLPAEEFIGRDALLGTKSGPGLC